MPLNEVKGDMYDFCTHTFNTIKGKCFHGCHYCSIKKRSQQLKQNQRDIRLDLSEFKTNLGSGNFIFWGSSCDTFAEDVPSEWIIKSLEYICRFNNQYLLQTKNPSRMMEFLEYIPFDAILGTTIETNRRYPAMGSAPDTATRALAMRYFSRLGFKTMITIEPIMDFDLEPLLLYIIACNPEWVNIGADSKKCELPEPDSDKINELILNLDYEGIKVKKKKNLKRIF